MQSLQKAAAIAIVVIIFSSMAPRRGHADYLIDFDTTFPNFGYSYAYAGHGAPVDSVDPPPYTAIDDSDQVLATYDVTTGPAAKATFDTTMWNIPPDATYTYAGVGLGVGLVLPGDGHPTSGMLSDYTVKFDAWVTGYNEADDGLNTDLNVLIQTPDDEDPDTGAEQVSIGANGGNPGNLPELPRLTTTPQSFTINFGDLAPMGTNDYDFATSFADVFILILQLQPNVNADEVGIDNDTMLFVDNVRFEGAFATGALGGDYDADLDVDGNDFIIWQRGESPESLGAGDLDAIIANFGQSPAAAAAIPEPGFAGLTIILILPWLACGRRGYRNFN
jgi:hypothetical protein